MLVDLVIVIDVVGFLCLLAYWLRWLFVFAPTLGPAPLVWWKKLMVVTNSSLDICFWFFLHCVSVSMLKVFFSASAYGCVIVCQT